MQVESYLFFNGNAGDAIAFYEKALGAKVIMKMAYKESPEPHPPGMIPDNWGDKLMHASFTIGATTIMASDGCGDPVSHSGFSLSLNTKSEMDAERCFAALSECGQVKMPLSKTFWSPRFGMLTDKFGIGWMVNVLAEGCG